MFIFMPYREAMQVWLISLFLCFREEKLKDVLQKEFPKGVDLVYESVGGEMFNTCINGLAQKVKHNVV